ncbi:hypothetical protein DRP05_04920 [Archaeoglobales archaeon]|nr:MAG: hypothetical protein DRP05_04920 [Archaeoglobales archaeon]
MDKVENGIYKPFVNSSEVARRGLRAVPAFVRKVVDWIRRAALLKACIDNLLSGRFYRVKSQLRQIAMLESTDSGFCTK